MSAIDRRTNPRVAVDVDVRLERAYGGPVAARTVDLGAGGMRVATVRPLRVDEVLHFDMMLDEGRTVDGDARVMRLHPRSQYALRFERLAEQDLAALSEYVAAH
ncbi:PilZ domain-containing protein [Paraconexibacter sp.]|uniref:PilZ domain-containing protein n=1 Tax=Paraconexibacter sp. TaxID=2949640 RepID=UPI003561D292